MDSESELEREVLSNVLSSTLLFILFMGIYSMTFAASIYLYAFSKTNTSLVVVIALIVLYAFGLSELGIQWHITKQIFIDNGETRATAYVASLTAGGNVILLVNDILQVVGYILADWLLLWRCYNVVGKSTSSMIVPFFFFFCEVSLAVCFLGFTGKCTTLSPGSLTQQENTQNILFGAFNSVTAVTSLSATYIIYRKITTFTDRYGSGYSHYQRITRIVIETSVIYSLASVLSAISAILDSLPIAQNSSKVQAFLLYSTCTSFFTTGFAPTLMVALLGISSNSSHAEKSSEVVSSLRINAHNNYLNNTTGGRDLSTTHDEKDEREEIV